MPKTIYKISEILNMFAIPHYDAYYSICVHIILRQLSRGFIGFGTEGIVAFRLTRFINFSKTHTHTQIQMKYCEFGLRLSCYITLVLSVLGFV